MTPVEQLDYAVCWLWAGYRAPGGYGKVYWRRQKHLAHRLAYELLVGPVPSGMQVCHRCDNPSCVNPAHLFVGTQKDNMKDAVRKGRVRGQKTTHCPSGHEYTRDNTYVLPSRPHARYCRECHRRHSRLHWQRKQAAA